LLPSLERRTYLSDLLEYFLVKFMTSNHYIWQVLPVSLILAAEMLIFTGHMEAATTVHAVTLILLVLIAMYSDNRIYPILLLLPLFRLLNVAMPVFFTVSLYSYPLVYAPMFLPIYLIMKDGILSRSEAGITFKGFWFYLPLAVAVGFSLGWGEYNVLRPGMLLPSVDAENVLILSLTMILFVGLVEEFVFRSALQTVLETRMGSAAGLLTASIIFGFMHSGYHLPQELIYVSFAGAVFGLLFWMSKSLPVIAVAHGVTNISLFLVAPVNPWALVYLIGIPGLLFVLYAYVFKKMPRKIKPAEKSKLKS
jgi:hypothetical protein